MLAEVERTHESGQNFSCEYRLIAADGRTVWVLDETVAVRDDEYRPIFLQGFMVDITDRRAAQEAQRHSEELYRLVIEGTHDLITLVDADGVLRYASPSIQALQGWRPDEVIGRKWTDDVHPEDAATVEHYVESRRAGLDLPPEELEAFLAEVPLAAKSARRHRPPPLAVPAEIGAPRGRNLSTQEAFGRILG